MAVGLTRLVAVIVCSPNRSKRSHEAEISVVEAQHVGGSPQSEMLNLTCFTGYAAMHPTMVRTRCWSKRRGGAIASARRPKRPKQVAAWLLEL